MIKLSNSNYPHQMSIVPFLYHEQPVRLRTGGMMTYPFTPFNIGLIKINRTPTHIGATLSTSIPSINGDAFICSHPNRDRGPDCAGIIVISHDYCDHEVYFNRRWNLCFESPPGQSLTMDQVNSELKLIMQN